MELEPIPEYLKNSMRKHFLSGLKGHRSLEIYELDLFRWFRNETEKTWEKMEIEERKYIREQVSAGREEINDSGIVATDYYRKRTRYSHVIFLASLLESAMKRECDRLANALGERILFKPSELKGDPWSSRKTFLERHCSFQTPEELWGPIKILLSVRNALVHHNGEILLLTHEQISALGNVTGIDVTQSDVGIEAEYLDEATASVGNLMEFLNGKTNSVIDGAVRPQVVK